MYLKIARPLLEMQEVILDSTSTGPNPAYWVYGEIGPKWENMTIIAPGKWGAEYNLTYGHYHSDKQSEIYHLIAGEGILILQKGYEKIEEVILVRANSGDEVIIPGEWGHAWINTGPDPLISYDDRKVPHTSADYDPIAKKHGLAYYLIEEDGQPKTIPNPNYGVLPQPKWLNANEFKI